MVTRRTGRTGTIATPVQRGYGLAAVPRSCLDRGYARFSHDDLLIWARLILLAARPRADPNERPYLAWIQKHHIAGTHESPEAMNITTVCILESPSTYKRQSLTGQFIPSIDSTPSCTRIVHSFGSRLMLLLRPELPIPCATGSPLADCSPCGSYCWCHYWRQCSHHFYVEIHSSRMAAFEPLFCHCSFLPKCPQYAW